MIERKIIKALPSSFVKSAMKLSGDRGAGEAKLWVGQMSNSAELDAFFDFDNGYSYSFSRKNMLEYLNQVKFEYVYQKFNNYKDASLLTWNNNYSQVKALTDGFHFNRDFLMRLALVLVDANTNLKIQSLTKKTITDIRSKWKTIKAACETMVDTLVTVGLSNETLTSYNATMPIAYYLFKGGKLKDKDSLKEVNKFLSVAMAKRLFGVASNSALNSTRNALQPLDCKKTAFTLSLFSDVTLIGGRNFNVTKDDVEYWLEHYEKGQSTYVLLALLYPNLKLSQVTFHQDHCHPYAGFDNKNIKSLGLSEAKVADWQWKRNLLPNLQFLEGSENESKNKTPLKDWVSSGKTFEYYPSGVSLELKDFDAFFEARRILVKKELFRLFGLTYEPTDDAADKARVLVP